MSQFDTNFAALARPALLAEHGRTVTYTTGGAGTSITAAFLDQSQSESDASAGRTRRREGLLQVSAADVAAPLLTDTVTIGSDTWSDESIESQDVGGLTTLRLVRLDRASISRSDYRMRR